MDIKKTIEQIEDFLIMNKNLDSYEKSLYYHLFRNSRLISKIETIFVISNAQKCLGLSDSTVRDRLRKLDDKGCIKILDTTRDGVKVSVLLPDEIPNVIPVTLDNSIEEADINSLDFYNDYRYRETILNRENGECFYCFKKIDKSNFVLDHFISQQNKGDNSYKNIVASCHECNSIKAGMNGDDFLRKLLRKNIISSKEFENQIEKTEKLKCGELKPF
jgi:DNA-binding Lrp family transcriptional regulator